MTSPPRQVALNAGTGGSVSVSGLREAVAPNPGGGGLQCYAYSPGHVAGDRGSRVVVTP